MKTTLNKIREHDPCHAGWERLLKHLGKTKADGEPLSLLTILKSNGLDDALWCLRAVDGCEKEMRLFAVWCARQVQHLMTDQESINALDVAERYAHGLATDKELETARVAARDVAKKESNAKDRALVVSWVAVWAAESDAVCAVVNAAYDAAYVVARVAARATDLAKDWRAQDATYKAARSKQAKEFKRILMECE